jgi:hypothetical protein
MRYGGLADERIDIASKSQDREARNYPVQLLGGDIEHVGFR